MNLFIAFEFIFAKIKRFLHLLPCIMKTHQWEYVAPEDFKLIYEQLECKCSIFFKSTAQLKDHYKHGATACLFDRACLRCGKVELQLVEAVNEFREENYQNEIAKEMIEKERNK